MKTVKNKKRQTMTKSTAETASFLTNVNIIAKEHPDNIVDRALYGLILHERRKRCQKRLRIMLISLVVFAGIGLIGYRLSSYVTKIPWERHLGFLSSEKNRT